MEGKSKYAVIMQFWYNISESLETQIGKGHIIGVFQIP